MEMTEASRILKRTGLVLLIVGLLDISLMVYCVSIGISYSSSFNIFAAIAGVYLMRGSLRAAVLVRWYSMFMLAVFASFILATPFWQPFDLTLTQLRLSPWKAVGMFSLVAFVLGLLAWLYTQLGSESIRKALDAAGRTSRDMRIPAVLGVGLVVVGTICMSVILHGESASKALSIAARQLGPEYHYHLNSLRISTNRRGKFVSGEVTAWDSREIVRIPVRWEEH